MHTNIAWINIAVGRKVDCPAPVTHERYSIFSSCVRILGISSHQSCNDLKPGIIYHVDLVISPPLIDLCYNIQIR